MSLVFIKAIILAYTALFPISNPLGNALIFASMMEGRPKPEARVTAWKAGLYTGAILLAFFAAGTFILEFFGITLNGVRIAGGFVVAAFGARLLHAKAPQAQPHEEEAAAAKDDISFTPLALPMLAGPGSIAVVMTMGARAPEIGSAQTWACVAAIVLIAITAWICLRQASGILHLLGVNGVVAVTKIMAFLLLCMGVQIMINGVVGALSGLRVSS